MQRSAKMFLKLVVLTALLCYTFMLSSQQLVNPSFEGYTAVAVTPQGWQAFGESSSPDTQPGAWSVTKEASHGYSYMSMVCRGYSIIDSYKYESCKQTLQQPLLPMETYHYSIDLAHSPRFKADTFTFNKPVNLHIFGMNEMNQKEKLWESGPVSNTEWKTFYFELSPSFRTPYLILEAYYAEDKPYNGNILVDNMQYYPQKPIIENKTDSMVADKEFDLNQNEMPDAIDGREVHQNKELLFRGNKLTITVWDNRTTDGDIISLFLNEKNILKEYEIGKTRLDVEVDVEENKEYYLTLYAHNLGSIPPNTVAMYITDGERKKFLTLSSDLNKCEAVKMEIESALVDL